MPERKRFESDKIAAALRLLRALPPKDGRKNTQEALRLLESGMREAQDKGYNQREIREKMAEAEVIVSATTLKDFLAGKKDRASKNRGQHRGGVAVKNATHKPEPPAQTQHEDMEENYSPGSIIIRPDTPRDEL